MKLFEYQAKEIFKECGITVPESRLIDTPDALEEAVEVIGLPCVVKAQVLHGGRGKAGLVKFCRTQEEALSEGRRIMEKTGHSLLVEAAVDKQQELYVSITGDPVTGEGLIMVCGDGGMDIEEIARTEPEKILKEHIDLEDGFFPYIGQNLFYELGFDKDTVKAANKFLASLYKAFRKYEAELVEVNPLMITKDGRFVAADGKLNIDDHAVDRYPQFERTRQYYNTDLEYEAAQVGVPFIQFDGDIGMLVAGAGLANVVFDLINYNHGSVCTYLEFGGPNYSKGKTCMELMLRSKPKGILIVAFGTIARADVMAEGIVEAYEELKPDVPVVTAIRGTGEERAKELLAQTPFEAFDDVEEAVARIIELTTGGAK
jgi:succinyl-CoA synthetase beta subunit